jgi:hypothetical protein
VAEIADKVVVTNLAVAEAKTAAEGASTMSALTALAKMGAGNGRDKQQSTKKWQNGSCGGGNSGSHDQGNRGKCNHMLAVVEAKAAKVAGMAANVAARVEKTAIMAAAAMAAAALVVVRWVNLDEPGGLPSPTRINLEEPGGLPSSTRINLEEP